jgi:hypothetical protein
MKRPCCCVPGWQEVPRRGSLPVVRLHCWARGMAAPAAVQRCCCCAAQGPCSARRCLSHPPLPRLHRHRSSGCCGGTAPPWLMWSRRLLLLWYQALAHLRLQLLHEDPCLPAGVHPWPADAAAMRLRCVRWSAARHRGWLGCQRPGRGSGWPLQPELQLRQARVFQQYGMLHIRSHGSLPPRCLRRTPA